MTNLFDYILEILYIAIGLQFLYTSIRVMLNPSHNKKLSTALFWFILAIIFTVGAQIPPYINGILLCIVGFLTLIKGIVIKNEYKVTEQIQEEKANKYKNKIFVPVIIMALFALLLAQLVPSSSKSALGIAAVISIIVSMVLTNTSLKSMMDESDRMVQQVGTTGILPQLLAALGVIFATAGVGEVISKLIGNFVPNGSILAGCIAYVLGMVIFTMIMGNAFAAFTVITTGIGIPFVISQGANPAIACALAMTSGYCGTLLTPMAGNFNALPIALLEMKDNNKIIKEQAIYSFILIIIHILLMYFWAF